MWKRSQEKANCRGRKITEAAAQQNKIEKAV